MDSTAAPLQKLIEQFARLPGVGRKMAQRFAFYVLDLPEDKAKEFSSAILEAKSKIKKCAVCGNFTEGELCPICSAKGRDTSLICVVEDPRDVLAFERTREYNGVYHVLHGLISPMDGIGPDQLTIKELLARIGKGEVAEVIMPPTPPWRAKRPPCISQSCSSRWGSRSAGLPTASPWAATWNTPMR